MIALAATAVVLALAAEGLYAGAKIRLEGTPCVPVKNPELVRGEDGTLYVCATVGYEWFGRHHMRHGVMDDANRELARFGLWVEPARVKMPKGLR